MCKCFASGVRLTFNIVKLRQWRLEGLFLWSVILYHVFASNSVEAAPGEILWTFNAPDVVHQEPTVAEDGTVYVGSDKLYALNPDGSLIWDRDIFVIASPVVAFDGSLYVPTSYRTPPGIFEVPAVLLFLNPDGSDRWKFIYPVGEIGRPNIKAPSIGSGGTLYVPFVRNYYGEIRAFRWDGIPLWALGIDAGTRDIAIGVDGNIFVLSETTFSLHSSIKSYRSDGTLRWEHKVPASRLSSPAIAEDGTLYIGAGNELIALTDDGTTRWIFSAPEEFLQAPAVSSIGTIFVSAGRVLYCLDQKGEKLWEFEAEHPVATPAAISSGGDILFGSVSNYLYSLNSKGNFQWKLGLEPGYISAPVIGRDGKILIRSGHTLYAIDNGGDGPDQGGWPMIRKNPNQDASQFAEAVVPGVPEWAETKSDQSGIRLLWTNVPYATSYEVWKGTNSNILESSLVAANIGARTDFLDSYTEVASTNYYWIRAKSGSVLGPYFGPITAISRKLNPGDLIKVVALNALKSELTFSKDGSLFVSAGSEAPEFTEKGLYAITADGSTKWDSFTAPPLARQLSISEDGNIFASLAEDYWFHQSPFQQTLPVSCFGVSNGVFKSWIPPENPRFKDGTPVQFIPGQSVAIGADNTVYASSPEGLLSLRPPEFLLDWIAPTEPSKSAPAIGPNGTIYLGTQANIYAIQSNGALQWSFSSSGRNFNFSLALDAGSRVYARSSTNTNWYADTLHCIDPAGRELWHFSNGRHLSPPAVGSEGTLYLGGRTACALNPDGNLRWQFEGEKGQSWSAPSIGSDGAIYFTKGAHIFAFDPKGTIRWTNTTHTIPDVFVTSPVFLDEGYVVAGSNLGIFYFKAGTGTDWAPWPMVGHDPQRSFRSIQRGLRISTNDGNTLSLEMLVERGRHYRLESSKDLHRWDLMSEFTGTNALHQYPTENKVKLFYRIVYVP